MRTTCSSKLTPLTALLACLVFQTFSNSSLDAKTVPDPDAPGPYAVGSLNLELPVAHRPDTLPVIIWYPVDRNLIDPNTTLRADYPLPPVFPFPVPSEFWDFSADFFNLDRFDPAYQNVPPAGTFPLVLFSHGGARVGWDFLRTGARLASHGFVVTTFTHPHEGFGCGIPGLPCDGEDEFLTIFENRPLDVSRVIDFMLSSDNPLSGAVDSEQIYAIGMSRGASAIVEAFVGGDTRIQGMVSYDGGLGFDLEFHGNEVVVRTNMDSDLAQVTVPFLLFSQSPCAPVYGGQLTTCQDLVSLDTCLENEFVCEQVEDCLHPQRAQAVIPSQPSLIVIPRTEHVAPYTNFCESAFLGIFLGLLPPDIVTPCTDETLIPFGEAQRVVNKFTVAFLKSLTGTPGYQRFLTPGYFRKYELNAELINTQSGNIHSLEHTNASFFCEQPGR